MIHLQFRHGRGKTLSITAAALSLLTSVLLGTPAHAGSVQKSLTVGDTPRTYFVYIPKSYSPTLKVPVVFVLHPLTKDAAWAEKTMGWDQSADKNGFIVVYGQSSSDRGVWNAGLTPSERASGADDVSYLEDVISAVKTSYAVDTTGVYMVGFSAGAIMTGKMGVTIPQSLSAIATVEGITGFANRNVFVPTKPISILMFRGTADDVTPYTSDVTSSLFHVQLYGATDTAADWAKADGCTDPPTTLQVSGGHIVATDYKGGTSGAEVELMTVNGGKHEYKTEDTDLIWQFFKTHKKETNPVATAQPTAPAQ